MVYLIVQSIQNQTIPVLMVLNDEIIRSSLDDSSLDNNSQQLSHFQQQGKFLLGHIHADTQADIAGNT